jgi:hypothetical protein
MTGYKDHFLRFFWIAPVVDAFKGIQVPISWQVMTRIIRGSQMLGGMMGSSAQIGLHAGCPASPT